MKTQTEIAEETLEHIYSLMGKAQGPTLLYSFMLKYPWGSHPLPAQLARKVLFIIETRLWHKGISFTRLPQDPPGATFIIHLMTPTDPTTEKLEKLLSGKNPQSHTWATRDRSKDCPACHGRGRRWVDVLIQSLGTKICPSCGGTGKASKP